jgi:hypothetical protein
MSGLTGRGRGWVPKHLVTPSTPLSLMHAQRSILEEATSPSSGPWLDGAAPADIAPSLYNLTRLKKLTVE